MVLANTALFQAIHTILAGSYVHLQNIVYEMIHENGRRPIVFLHVFAMNYVMDVRSSAMDVVAAR